MTKEFDPTLLEPQDVDLPGSYPVPEGWLKDWDVTTRRISRLWPPNTISANEMERRAPELKKAGAVAEFAERKLDLRTTFDTEPEPLDIILPGMVSQTVGMLAAAGATGKSMWAVQAGMSIACGGDLFRLFETIDNFQFRKGRVVYACAEDQRPILHHRMYGMAQLMREADPETASLALDEIVDNFDVFDLYGSGIPIESRPAGTSSWGLLLEQAKGARLVIIDTLIRFAGGRSENDNVEMGGMMKAPSEGLCVGLL